MFEKNVAGMVKTLRENSESSACVSACLSEIRSELTSANLNIKVNAMLKLGYLSMLGIDMQVAQMPVIETMSVGNFLLKRPSMFVASLAFRDSPDLLLLTTNIFLKEFKSPNFIEAATAVSCMASVCTADIANGVVSTLLNLSCHNSPYVRKKVALSFFRMCEKSPNLFLSVLPKLKDLLSDPDQSVQAAAVNTFVEISKRNAKLVMTSIPSFFHLLKEVKCNWILIKLLKLMEYICQVEPRMWSKLVSGNVLGELNTKAKSVQVEFTRFVLRAAPIEESDIVAKALIFLKEFLTAADPNIKCIAFNIAADFLDRFGKQRELYRDYKDSIRQNILRGVDSSDSTLRGSALRALSHLVDSPDSATHAIQQLLALYSKFEDSKLSVKSDIVKAVLQIGSRGEEFILDTEWYLRILVLLSADHESFTAEIVKQFKEYSRARDPSIVVKIALAALNRPSLSDSLSSACAWALGFHAHTHWDPLMFSPDAVSALIQGLVSRASSSSLVETQVDCVWGALRVGIAVYLNIEAEMNDALSLVKFNLEKNLSHANSVALSEVTLIALEVIAWIEASNKTIHHDEIKRVIFNTDCEDTFVEIPTDFTCDPSLSWHYEEEETTEDVVYTDSEEDISSSGVVQESDLFSFQSVLMK